MNLQDYISDLDLAEHQTKRVDCPVCGGRNTFTCSRLQGKLIYNCYKADCRIRGAYAKHMSAEELKQWRIERKYAVQESEYSFELPEHIIVSTREELQDYAESVHAEEAELLYDVRENRAVFIIRDPDTHKMMGAVGRALDKHRLPKWRRYDSLRGLMYTVGDSSTAVLVEDCASATAVASAGLTGVALLGTNLAEVMIPKLYKYEQIIVALDKDASAKALKIKKSLDPYVPTTVRLLPDDLKYFEPSKIQAILSLSA